MVYTDLPVDDNLSSFSMPKKTLRKSYLLLSCKIDSLYYALQYYIDDLPEITWFIDQIPVLSNNYCKILPDGSYVLVNPYEVSCGGLTGQLARISHTGKLMVKTSLGYHEPLYTQEGMLDVDAIKDQYGKVISFGVDNLLLLSTFEQWFDDKELFIRQFEVEKPSVEKMVALFIHELRNRRVIICNGVVSGFKHPRTFTFGIMGSDDVYKWKEASHSFVIIGYDYSQRSFLIADNYGTYAHPYQPAFYYLTFEALYHMITLLDPSTFDNSFSLGYM